MFQIIGANAWNLTFDWYFIWCKTYLMQVHHGAIADVYKNWISWKNIRKSNNFWKHRWRCAWLTIVIFLRLILTDVSNALKTFAMFSGKSFEWVPSLWAHIFMILPTPVTPIFKSFSLHIFQTFKETLNGQSVEKDPSRPLSPIISEAPVLTFSLVYSRGEWWQRWLVTPTPWNDWKKVFV